MLRNRIMAAVAAGALFVAGAAVMAQQGGPGAGAPGAAEVKTTKTFGTVKSIADDKASFVVKPGKGDDVTVKVNADTKYKAADADSTFADVVKVDGKVVVTLNADGVATLVISASALMRRKGPANS